MFTASDLGLLTQASIAISLMSLVLLACYCDWSQRRIPNALSLGGACWGLVLQLIFSGLDGLIYALSGWAVGFAFLFPGYALGKTGAGDVKLLAAVGTYIGPYSAMITALATLLIGAMMALAIVLLSQGAGPWRRYGSMCRCLFATGHWVYQSPAEGEAMAGSYPYAFAIALGAVVGYSNYLIN